MSKEEKTLSLEDIKLLLEKVYAAQRAEYDKCVTHLELLAGEKHGN